jgi:hypothetical protein
MTSPASRAGSASRLPGSSPVIPTERSETEQAPSSGVTADCGTRRLGLALLVIASAQLMVVLDGTIVNVALPHWQQAPPGPDRCSARTGRGRTAARDRAAARGPRRPRRRGPSVPVLLADTTSPVGRRAPSRAAHGLGDISCRGPNGAGDRLSYRPISTTHRGGTMTMSNDLERLSVRAKQAEDRAAAAKAQARDQLQQAVAEARDSTQQTADELRAESAAAADRADKWADNIQRSWDEHLTRARERIDARKAQHAADRTESDAEDAESYADYSIDLAYSAIAEAEYAVLDAVLARQDADEAARSVTTSHTRTSRPTAQRVGPARPWPGDVALRAAGSGQVLGCRIGAPSAWQTRSASSTSDS